MSPAGPSSPPIPQDATAPYQGSAGAAYHDGKRALAPAALEWVYRLRAQKFQPWIAPVDTVLEYGVGSGWNLARLRCGRKLGCDAADFLAPRLAALGIQFLPNTTSVANASVDVVLCHHTLEHLLEPISALHEMARVLKPDARLVLYVPWEIERRYARFNPSEPNHHLYHWNAQNLGNLATVLGWRIEQIRARTYGYDRFAANFAARFRLGEAGFRLLRRLLVTLRPLREIELIARRPNAEAPPGSAEAPRRNAEQ